MGLAIGADIGGAVGDALSALEDCGTFLPIAGMGLSLVFSFFNSSALEA